MQKEQEELNIGVLDIYGFEIFQVRSIMCLIKSDSTNNMLAENEHQRDNWTDVAHLRHVSRSETLLDRDRPGFLWVLTSSGATDGPQVLQKEPGLLQM